jgi:hypothetical protein
MDANWIFSTPGTTLVSALTCCLDGPAHANNDKKKTTAKT